MSAKHIAVYTRVSTQGQAATLADQSKRVHEWAELRYHAFGIESYSEVATRDDPRRPEFRRMCKAISAGKVRAVVCQDLTRLLAGAAALANLAEKMAPWKTELVTLDGRFDISGAGGRIVLAVLAELSAWELENHRARIRRGITEYRKKSGGTWGRRRIELQISLDEIERRVTVDGASRAEIAQELGVSPDLIGRRLREHKRKRSENPAPGTTRQR